VYRIRLGGRHYETDKYTASFAGFFSAESPKYVIVICFEAKRDENAMFIHFGGGRPAMAFAEIVTSISR
jgi:cell division protein FtsI/penicillin-binding protein 2